MKHIGLIVALVLVFATNSTATAQVNKEYATAFKKMLATVTQNAHLTPKELVGWCYQVEGEPIVETPRIGCGKPPLAFVSIFKKGDTFERAIPARTFVVAKIPLTDEVATALSYALFERYGEPDHVENDGHMRWDLSRGDRVAFEIHEDGTWSFAFFRGDE